MSMGFRVLVLSGLLAASLFGVGGASFTTRDAPSAAASGGGMITGQVVWCAPAPLAYGAPSQPGAETPGLAPEVSPAEPPEETLRPGAYPPVPVPWPPKPRLIPAGAVLVAVQGTSLSTRTDERGYFRIENVPVGQYMTVGFGPVRGVSSAVALRPNVFVEKAGQTARLDRISLGQSCGYEPLPYMAPGAPEVQPDEAQ